ncbi:MAG: transketolase C-terminal domain-containing protein [Negativicutes bacterium]|nr:transketolase C-terminal domain-containing protein [Negativicutes bacterium]
MSRQAAEERSFISGNEAVAYGVRLCRPQVIAAYPITPQTTAVEKLAEFIERCEMDCEYVNVESEHSAMAAAMGAAMMGCRTFTASSSQGLLYMCEMLHYVSGSRFPIVMMNANRTVAAPWNIFGDHRDSMSMRDAGWMQLYVENSQEALDMIIQAYKLAEHSRVQTPVMVCLDGFVLTHTYEVVSIPAQDAVDAFLPPYTPSKNILDLDDPKSLCISVSPEWQTEFRFAQYEAMEEAKRLIPVIDREFAAAFGRSHGGLIEEYRCEDAEYVLVAMGSVAGTARLVVDSLRDEGLKVGLVKIRFFRPFPKEELAALAERVKGVGVIDREVSFGYEGALYTEVKAALAGGSGAPKTVNFIAGLSGRDITKENIAAMYRKVMAKSEGQEEKEVQFVALRWEQW